MGNCGTGCAEEGSATALDPAEVAGESKVNQENVAVANGDIKQLELQGGARGGTWRRRRHACPNADDELYDSPQALQTFTTNFVQAATLSPLIGNRLLVEPLSASVGSRIAEGLRAEACRLDNEGEDGSLFVAINTTPAWAKLHTKLHRKDGKLDLAQLFDTCPEEELPRLALWAYSVDCFLNSIPNRVLRRKDESRGGFSPFIRLLHDTLAHSWGGVERFNGPVFRVTRLDNAAAAAYEANPTQRRANFFAWTGFTSCCCVADIAFEMYRAFGANTLMIIECDDPENAPTDVRRCSDFGHEEAEVLFNLGQRFQKRTVETRRCNDVWTELGVSAGACEPGEMRVIKLRAVDAFAYLAGDLLKDNSNEQEALEMLQSRVAYEKTRCGPESRAACAAMRLLGNSYRLVGRLADAKATLELERSISERVFGQTHEHTAKSYDALGAVLLSMGRNKDAIVLQKKCLQILLAANGEGDKEQLAMCYTNLGTAYMKEKECDTALEHFMKALDIRKTFFGEFSAETASSFVNVAETLRMMERREDALPYQEQGVRIRKKVLGDRHSIVGDDLVNLALIYTKVGRREEAMNVFQEALSIVVEHHGPRNDKMGIIWNTMGYLEQKNEHYLQAIRYYERAYDIWAECLGEQHPHTQYAGTNLEFCRAQQL